MHMNASRVLGVVAEQDEERKRLLEDRRLIKRDSLDHWSRFVGSDLVKVTTGVRRSGKSTFTHLLLRGSDYAYVNFDDDRLAPNGRGDLDAMLEVLYSHYGQFDHILLDEVQNVEGWELFVNRLQRGGLKTYVTGSNANLLGRELATHLTGRTVQMELLPFSFREFLAWRDIPEGPPTTRRRAVLKRQLQDYMVLGGFPEVVRDPAIAREYLTSLYSSILIKDVVARHGIRFVRTFKDLATTLLSSTATLMTYNRLKDAHGIKSVHTVKNYVDLMAEAYLLLVLDKLSAKPREVQNSPKKVYAIDTGLIGPLSVSASEDRGRLMENLAFLHLRRRLAVEPGLELFYWSDYTGHEVDFVVRRARKVEALVQVTFASGPDEISPRVARGLVKAADLLGCKDLRIVTWDYEGRLRRGGRTIECVPMWRWLLE